MTTWVVPNHAFFQMLSGPPRTRERTVPPRSRRNADDGQQDERGADAGSDQWRLVVGVRHGGVLVECRRVAAHRGSRSRHDSDRDDRFLGESERRGGDRDRLLENARILAALNVAMADATIGCWDQKVKYNFWRPITAIRESGDPTWTPLFATPAHQDYPSGHSCVSGAATAILADEFGEKTPFALKSDVLVGVSRTFRSFSEALEDVKDARVSPAFTFVPRATTVPCSVKRSHDTCSTTRSRVSDRRTQGPRPARALSPLHVEASIALRRFTESYRLATNAPGIAGQMPPCVTCAAAAEATFSRTSSRV